MLPDRQFVEGSAHCGSRWWRNRLRELHVGAHLHEEKLHLVEGELKPLALG
jgi:hypothetical protein